MSADANERLDAQLSAIAWEHLAQVNGPGDWRLGSETYEIEDTDDPDDALVFVRKSDGARFEIDVWVTAVQLPAERAS